MRLYRIVFGALSAVFAVACGDSCCADPVLNQNNEPPKCTVAAAPECEDGFEFRHGACVPGGCLEDSECCPGTRCRADLNVCFPLLLDSEYECDDNSDCQDPAQRCVVTQIGNREPLPTCVYEICTGDSDCGFGRTCYEGRCVIKAPCNGNCPAGTACDVVSGQCAEFPAGSVGCDAECGANQLKVFVDPLNMSGEQCCGLECACRALPPVVPSRFGRYSRVAVGTEVLVSAYDAEFGDLVLARYNLQGGFTRLDYVDGLPVNGAVVSDPLGPRGGVTEPGPNVGTHTSIALNAEGLARIAYHDEDGRSLKVAIQQADGTFRNYFLDGDDAQAKIGQFTDIAVADNGVIFVTYLAHNATIAGVSGRATGIKMARSRSANPSSAADWDVIVVDARPIFDPCGTPCANGAQCVLAGGAPQCLAPVGGCAPACGSTESCVDPGTGPECAGAPLPPESPDLPRARGVYTSITLDGNTPIVAYYDHIDGDLRAATFNGDTATPVIVDGDGVAPRRGGDVGRFPTVAKIGNNVTLVYEDFGRHEVRAWQGAATELGTAGAYSLVDIGAPDAGRSGKRYVGAGARLAQKQNQALVVYQDASNLDLKLASLQGTTWLASRLVDQGAHGFYSDVAVLNGTAYIVSVEARLDERGIEASRLGLLVQPVP